MHAPNECLARVSAAERGARYPMRGPRQWPKAARCPATTETSTSRICRSPVFGFVRRCACGNASQPAPCRLCASQRHPYPPARTETACSPTRSAGTATQDAAWSTRRRAHLRPRAPACFPPQQPPPPLPSPRHRHPPPLPHPPPTSRNQTSRGAAVREMQGGQRARCAQRDAALCLSGRPPTIARSPLPAQVDVTSAPPCVGLQQFHDRTLQR